MTQQKETLEDCSGCTDDRSEGTHQMHTKQHPCQEGGDPNCGYCFPQKETWEARFDQVFLTTMYQDDGYSEERSLLKDLVRELLQQAEQRGADRAVDYIEKVGNGEYRHEQKIGYRVSTYMLSKARTSSDKEI